MIKCPHCTNGCSVCQPPVDPKPALPMIDHDQGCPQHGNDHVCNGQLYLNENPHGGPDDPYETIKVIEAWGLDKNFNLATVVSKIRTSDKKGNNVQDLKDARWYLDREISKLEGMPDPAQPDMFKSTEKETTNG